jgi:AAA ATPase domain/Adenylate and Guanylate cyclase catalytic domain/Amidase
VPAPGRGPSAHGFSPWAPAKAGVPGVDTIAAVPLQVRIGIATGLVVVGDLIGQGASQEQAVVGETPNLAARLQALAEPGAVVIAPSTRRLTGGYEDLGAVEIKGLAAPVLASRVLRESGAESRFEALRATATPLVGRDEELAMLHRRWQQTKSGEGCVVLISGEPGIGKSRLAQTLLEAAPTSPRHRTLIEPEAPPARLRRLANTAQFDCTHHPAMSLPCGMIDGLPVGMMLVAKAFDEETIYRAAAAFERGVDWKTLPDPVR